MTYFHGLPFRILILCQDIFLLFGSFSFCRQKVVKSFFVNRGVAGRGVVGVVGVVGGHHVIMRCRSISVTMYSLKIFHLLVFACTLNMYILFSFPFFTLSLYRSL